MADINTNTNTNTASSTHLVQYAFHGWREDSFQLILEKHVALAKAGLALPIVRTETIDKRYAIVTMSTGRLSLYAALTESSCLIRSFSALIRAIESFAKRFAHHVPFFFWDFQLQTLELDMCTETLRFVRVQSEPMFWREDDDARWKEAIGTRKKPFKTMKRELLLHIIAKRLKKIPHLDKKIPATFRDFINRWSTDKGCIRRLYYLGAYFLGRNEPSHDDSDYTTNSFDSPNDLPEQGQQQQQKEEQEREGKQKKQRRIGGRQTRKGYKGQ